MIITINDWQKFNPRKDDRNHSWFRFENDFFLKTFAWSMEEQHLFSYLCCCKSKSKEDKIYLELKLASALLKRKESQIIGNLKSLQSYGVVTLSVEEVTATIGCTTNVTLRTDDTNVTNDTHTSISDVTIGSHLLLFSIWNQWCDELPKAKGMNSERKNKSKIRWNENPDPKYWEEVVCKISKSSFCRGKTGKGWVATFDWLLKPDTHLRVIEGKYDDRSGSDKTDVEEHNRKVFERVNKKIQDKKGSERDVSS